MGRTFATNLRCRVCGEGYPLEAIHACERCFGPLEVTYDYDAIRAVISREQIERGPRTIWRYRDLLPIASDHPVDLGARCTPLYSRRATRAYILWLIKSPVSQERLREPHLLVQGSRSSGGKQPRRGTAGPSYPCLRIHREPGIRRRRGGLRWSGLR